MVGREGPPVQRATESRTAVRMTETSGVTTQLRVGDEIPQGSGVIEVHLVELNQLFNSIDPSPFHERDLDRDAEEFIVRWAKDIPAEKPLRCWCIDKPGLTPDVGDTVRDAVHTFFRNRSEQTRKRLGQLFRAGRTSLLIGLLFLAACLLGGDWIVRLFSESRLAEIVRESLIIGGWVAMWRPLEIFLYDWWPILNERRLYDRLSQMAVRIACSGSQAPDRRPAVP